MVGTGLTPEGIDQNYVIYDLMTDVAWEPKPVKLETWFTQYSARRYGRRERNVEEAWQILSVRSSPCLLRRKTKTFLHVSCTRFTFRFQTTVYNFQGLELIRGKYSINRSPQTNDKIWVSITVDVSRLLR